MAKRRTKRVPIRCSKCGGGGSIPGVVYEEKMYKGEKKVTTKRVMNTCGKCGGSGNDGYMEVPI